MRLDIVQKETLAVSVMIQRLETDAIRDEKDNRDLLHRERRHRLTERYQAAEGERQDSVPKFPKGKCTYPSCTWKQAQSRTKSAIILCYFENFDPD